MMSTMFKANYDSEYSADHKSGADDQTADSELSLCVTPTEPGVMGEYSAHTFQDKSINKLDSH